jgi:cell cycle checkpoint protein
MSEAGVTTTCDLTTYEADTTDEIPFQRDSLALKTIMRSPCLLDAISELSSMNPQHLTIQANPDSRTANLSLSATGSLGSATVDFTAHTDSEDPVLETFQCAAKTSSSFKFGLIKSAQRAMQAASKVSMRLDEDGVLSMQYLVEIESGQGRGVTFVDFRVVPLVEGEAEDDDAHSSNHASE